MKRIALALALLVSLTSYTLKASPVHLRVEPEHSYILREDSPEVCLRIDLTGAGVSKSKRIPLNLSMIIDRSGSMAGAKIEKAKQAALLLVDQLSPEDYFSVVAYDSIVDVLCPSHHVEDKESIRQMISRIRPLQGTALYAGLAAGARELRKHYSTTRLNRAILLSDGLANVGPSSPRELRGLARELAAESLSVTTVGVGDDYNEELMAGIAEASDANYYFVQDTEKLPAIFAKELHGLLARVASEINIRITLPKNIRPIGFVGRSEKFNDNQVTIRFNDLNDSQSRYLLLLCRPTDLDKSQIPVVDVHVDYRDNEGANQSVTETVQVRVTSDPSVAEKSLNKSIFAQRQLLLSAQAKEEAIREADAGNYRVARERLNVRSQQLQANMANAPAELQSQFKAEIKDLNSNATALEQNAYAPSQRKSLQQDAWNGRNSKSYSQP